MNFGFSIKNLERQKNENKLNVDIGDRDETVI